MAKHLRQLLAAHHYWRRRGMMVDLVVLNLRPTSYLQDLEQSIMAAIHASQEGGMMDRRAASSCDGVICWRRRCW